MEKELTKQDILDLFVKQSKLFDKKLEQERLERAKSREEYDEKLEQERLERAKSQEKFEKELKESSIEFEKRQKRYEKLFNKQLGEITNKWGKFVSEMVRPKIVELFNEKGILIETTAQSIEGFKDKQKYYEIDLLLLNTNVAVVVEVKSSLSVEDVKEHIERLDKIKQVAPKRINLSGVTIYGAVAGMIIENDADKYAYKKGLYVLRQKGNTVEIVNDKKFEPQTWQVNY